MSENPHQDIIDGSMSVARKLYQEEWGDAVTDIMGQIIGSGIMQERVRCISIVKSIEPMNPSEAHLIETIVRKMRGDE